MIRSYCTVALALLLGASLNGCSKAPEQGSGLLSAKKSKPDDLALSGAFAGLPDGAIRYISHDALLALPETQVIAEEPSARMGKRQCTVLFLSDLLKHLPMAAGADCILAHCVDHWESSYSEDFIERWKPYILLKLDGKKLDGLALPPPLDHEKLAPYFINVPYTLVPAFRNTDYKNVDPVQVVELMAVKYAERFKPWFSGPYANMDAKGRAGRDIFLNNCASCHRGPGGTCGGQLSNRTWEMLTMHASVNRKYFVDYVKTPQKYIPGVAMPNHEDFSAETFEQLIAFLSTGTKFDAQ